MKDEAREEKNYEEEVNEEEEEKGQEEEGEDRSDESQEDKICEFDERQEPSVPPFPPNELRFSPLRTYRISVNLTGFAYTFLCSFAQVSSGKICLRIRGRG